MVPLTPIFTKNKELLISLSSLLDNEREALGRLDSQIILTIASQKQTILDELDALNKKRHSLLLKFGVIRSPQSEEGQFKAWLDKQSLYDDLKQLIHDCEQLLETCKAKNLVNEHILSIAQQRNKTLLEIFQGTEKKKPSLHRKRRHKACQQ